MPTSHQDRVVRMALSGEFGTPPFARSGRPGAPSLGAKVAPFPWNSGVLWLLLPRPSVPGRLEGGPCTAKYAYGAGPRPSYVWVSLWASHFGQFRVEVAGQLQRPSVTGFRANRAPAFLVGARAVALLREGCQKAQQAREFMINSARPTDQVHGALKTLCGARAATCFAQNQCALAR